MVPGTQAGDPTSYFLGPRPHPALGCAGQATSFSRRGCNPRICWIGARTESSGWVHSGRPPVNSLFSQLWSQGWRRPNPWPSGSRGWWGWGLCWPSSSSSLSSPWSTPSGAGSPRTAVKRRKRRL